MDASTVQVALGWLLSLILGVAVALFVFAAYEEEDLTAEGDASRSKLQRRGTFLKVFGGLVVTIGAMISLIPLGASRKKLDTKLIEAGRPGALSADEFMAVRLICAVLWGLAGSYFDFELEYTPMCALGMGFLGLVYPDLWLSGRTKKRKRRMFRDLPDTLDTLRLSVDAGLDFNSAMKVVVDKGRRGPLIDELEKVDRDMSLGKTRADSLRAFAERVAMSEINAFVLALIQADQLGASIGPILHVQSDMARKRRWQTAEEVVNKLPMKMLGPLVLLIFPASFIILFTPLVIQYMQSP